MRFAKSCASSSACLRWSLASAKEIFSVCGGSAILSANQLPALNKCKGPLAKPRRMTSPCAPKSQKVVASEENQEKQSTGEEQGRSPSPPQFAKSLICCLKPLMPQPML